MNLPIYRAKKIDSDEFIEGLLTAVDENNINGLICCSNNSIHDVLLETLSINLPDILDSEGKKIFASLDKYYLKGADIVANDNFLGEYNLQVAIYSDGCFYVQDKDRELYNLCENWEKLKVTGIHK